MDKENNTSTEQVTLSNTDLAFERTILAENRTLMAWIRTAISLISFGFTIYKFFHEISQSAVASNQFFTPRKVGMLMIAFGLLALVWGLAEHKAVFKKLKKSYAGIEPSKTIWLAVLILLFGLLMFVGVFLRQ